eukprot:SAG22_NODE_3253_length_1829_cov_1.314451_1_plen_255_part_10
MAEGEQAAAAAQAERAMEAKKRIAGLATASVKGRAQRPSDAESESDAASSGSGEGGGGTSQYSDEDDDGGGGDDGSDAGGGGGGGGRSRSGSPKAGAGLLGVALLGARRLSRESMASESEFAAADTEAEAAAAMAARLDSLGQELRSASMAGDLAWVQRLMKGEPAGGALRCLSGTAFLETSPPCGLPPNWCPGLASWGTNAGTKELKVWRQNTSRGSSGVVRTEALSFCCASTAFLSKTVPFRAVLLNQDWQQV